MFREEMRVLGLPGAEDVTDGSVDYYDMDWENVENGVTEEQMAKCIAKECACTPRCKCSGNLEGVAFCRGAVDIFVIVVAQCLARRGLRRLGNGEGHVRFQCQQPPVQIGEGDDLLRREEAAVLLIQPVLLEPAHVIFAAARRLIQCPQRKGGPLLRLQIRQIKSHAGFPFRFPALCAAPSAPFALQNPS